MTIDIEALEQSNYMSFSTRKKSGDFVATPVWFAPDGDSYYVFSAGDAGKVKRLRNFSESRIAPCTVSGKVTGNWIETRAYVLDTAEAEKAALRALHRKYKWQMSMTDFLSALTGKKKKRAYIRIDPVN